MKKALYILAVAAILPACSQTQPDWSKDCERNYTVNHREKSECLKKVENNVSSEIKPGTISIDKHNTDRQSYTEAGRYHED